MPKRHIDDYKNNDCANAATAQFFSTVSRYQSSKKFIHISDGLKNTYKCNISKEFLQNLQFPVYYFIHPPFSVWRGHFDIVVCVTFHHRMFSTSFKQYFSCLPGM